MNLRRLTIFFGTLLATIGGYFLYAWIIVPTFLLPPLSLAESRATYHIDLNPTGVIERIGARYAELLAPLFPDGTDWRRNNPRCIIPREGGGLFLFNKEPEFSPNHRQLVLSACTIVVPMGDPTQFDEGERFRRALVLETRQDATFLFTRPIDLAGPPDLSAFEHGTFRGEVMIRSGMESPGPEDDFVLTTRDISFTSSQILANNDVVFQFGASHGEGEGLRVEMDLSGLTPVPNGTPTNPYTELVREGNLGGGFSVDWISVQKLNRLEFEVNGEMLKNFGGLTTGTDSADPMTVDIRCQNGILFAPNPENAAEWVGRFQDDVEVVVYHKTEKEDRLRCRTLYLYFSDPELEKTLLKLDGETGGKRPKRIPTGNLTRLVPFRVKGVRGEESPVTALVPQYEFEARGDEFVYDIPTGRMFVAAENASPVSLTYRDATITAEELDFTPAKSGGGFGTLWANRAGRLQKRQEEKDGSFSMFEASWREGIYITSDPSDPNLVKLAMKGDILFGWDRLGKISASEADFWGITRPNRATPAGKSDLAPIDLTQIDLVPQSAQFRGNIRMETPNGIGTIRDEMTIRFQGIESLDTMALAPKGAPGGLGNVGGGGRSEMVSAGLFGRDQSLFGADRKSRFDMEGGRLDLWVIADRDTGLDVDQMIIRQNIRFVESSVETGAETTRIEGDNVRIERPNSVSAAVQLVGRPANFKGEGLDLSGYDVRIDRAQNRFEVLGPGVLSFLSTNTGGIFSGGGLGNGNSTGAAVSSGPPMPIDVRWSHGMDFDGRVLSFRGAETEPVRVKQGESLELKSPEIRFSLLHPIQIFDLKKESGAKVSLATSECLGTYNQPVEVLWYGDLATSMGTTNGSANSGGGYRGQVRNLRLDHPTGKFDAEGPGWLRATLRTPTDPDSAPATPNRPLLGDFSASQKPWTHLHLTFQRGLAGNLFHRQFEAQGRVAAVVAMSDTSETMIDVEQPAALPTDAFYLSSERIGVAQNSLGDPPSNSMELSASENTLFRYDTFTGRGDQLKYDHRKKTVILEGSGINQAVIISQKSPGAAPITNRFRRGTFNLETKKIEADISHTTLDGLMP